MQAWGNICYIMINREHNRRIFRIYLLLQDDGTFTSGAFMRIIASHPIIQKMQGIPLVWSDAPALVMTNPNVFPSSIAVYLVALKHPSRSSLVVNHRTADVWVTLEITVTLVLVPVELSTSISVIHTSTYVVNAYVPRYVFICKSYRVTSNRLDNLQD